MLRSDISNKLIHFTKGETPEDFEGAFNNLKNIINLKCILGGNGKIKGNSTCVCFTEAPITSLEEGFVNSNKYSKYSPFGIMFNKKWIYDKGGRPVIYQPDHEFELLPKDFQWRHVRYEPDQIDFTWEREWRINIDKLEISQDIAGIVFPSKHWADLFKKDYDLDQELDFLLYEAAVDYEFAESNRKPFNWKITSLEMKDYNK